MIRIDALLTIGYRLLKRRGIKAYQADAQLILAHTIKRDRAFVLTNPGGYVSDSCADNFIKGIRRRGGDCPLPYIINSREFHSLPFYIDETVLIPRDDTEVLVSAAIDIIGNGHKKIIEIGTGSGIIAVCLAVNCKNAVITATDISGPALDTAGKNADLNRVNITFRQGDLFGALKSGDYPADMIISNPPYIKTGDIETLDSSVKDYEPITAIDGGADGLDFYRMIIEGASLYLLPQGIILFEIGYNQAEEVKGILTRNGFTGIKIMKDTNSLDRVIMARR